VLHINFALYGRYKQKLHYHIRLRLYKTARHGFSITKKFEHLL